MLRAIIIDDEQKGIDSLSLLLEKYVKDVKIVAQTTNASLAIELIENYKPEIVFLDINMPEMNGFELLEKINWREFDLIFTTAHQEYAIRAIRNNAIDYLLKPIDHEDLLLAVKKLQNRLMLDVPGSFNFNELLANLKPAQKHKIIVNSRSGIESLDVNEMICLESQSNYTKIYLTNSRTMIVSKTLKEFEGQLCNGDTKFMRVHHSFIINLDKVNKYLKTSENIIMQEDKQVPVAKSKKESFFKWLNI